MKVQVRAGTHVKSQGDAGMTEGDSSVTDEDSPSLLLYYLFDDWYTSYSLVARSKHHYGRQLDKVVCSTIAAWISC